MKKLLLIITHPRTSEKIISVIPQLSLEFKLDIYMCGQFSPKTPWYGDNDPRIDFIHKYEHYSNDYWSGPSFQQSGTYDGLFGKHSATEYDGVILDDNRLLPELQLQSIFNEFKKHDIPVIGNNHGNQDFDFNHLTALNRSFDYTFLFGRKEHNFYKKKFDSNRLLMAGIPSNDIIKDYKLEQNHILLIVNFLGNRTAPFNVTFDKNLIDNIGLKNISDESGVPIIVKLKARHDDPNYQNNVDYVHSWFDKEDKYEVITDGDNDDLIQKSAYVISAPSTFAFKSIQAGIPTVLLKGSGQVGNFYDYDFLVNPNEGEVKHSIIDQFDSKEEDFIENTLEGGLTFNSTDLFVGEIKRIIK